MSRVHTMRPICAVLSLAVLLLSAGQTIVQARQVPQAGPAAPAPGGRGAIRGRVAGLDTGAALPRVTVSVRVQGGRETRTATTDDEGRYEIRDLIPGRYTVSAGKTGYLTLSFGQRRPLQAGRPVEVTAGTAVVGIDFTLPRGSVIVARVTNQFGEPMAGLRVDVLQSKFSGGQQTLERVGATLLASTDDRGELRLYGLPPGDYYVLANPGPVGPREEYAATYFPGTMSAAEAVRIPVGLGEEVPISFALVPASQAGRISGILLDVNGAPSQARTLMLVQASRAGVTSMRGLQLDADGSFSASNIAPGSYILTVGDTSDGTVVEHPITVPAGADLSGLVVRATRGAVMRGRVVFDAGARTRNSQTVPLTLEAVSGPASSTRALVNDDGTFVATGLAGQRLLRLARETNGWFLKAVRYQGRDVTDAPFEFGAGTTEIDGVDVVVALQGSEVSGAVIDAAGRAVSECVVVAFPDDRERWTPFSRAIATGAPDQAGRFRIGELPPGTYRIIAVTYLEEGTEHNPDVLARLYGRAERLTLGDAASVAITLRLAD